jgi:hypothetical protein
MQITFGKWQGWDTDRLAKTGSFGRAYLDWGATNLQSPKWRREFKRALDENPEMDRGAMVQAIREHYPELVPELDQEIDIEMGEWASCQEAQEAKRKLTNFFERKLREMGISEMGVSYLVGNHWQIEELIERGKVKFANAKASEVIDLCGRYGEAICNLEYS